MRQVPTCQRAGRPGGEGIHVGLEDDVVGDGPALPACLKTSMSWSTVPLSTQGLARSLSGLNCIQRPAHSSAASQRWSVTTTALHQRIQFAPCLSVAGAVTYEPHSLVDFR